ncbi:hypothetical protein LAZ67_10001268 [Cordylochernes scorpioides]|uniref:Uncharacterized protein n=1 Tax=Cordylochernes scorpioides TaxID=51811 RepID=A0ABY6KVQ3_9ARAC|nr:hypothetical protein LAZ67_10001268 [Cordylochernes scorpioides]
MIIERRRDGLVLQGCMLNGSCTMVLHEVVSLEELHHDLTTCSYSFLECRRYSNISNMPKNEKYLW